MGGFCLLEGEALQEDPMNFCALNLYGQALCHLAAVNQCFCLLGMCPQGHLHTAGSPAYLAVKHNATHS